MKKVILTLNLCILTVVFAFLPPLGASGAVFCVTNETELQNALNTAQNNGEDDTIQVVQGTYTGNFSYTAGPNDDFSRVTLQGGFTTDCSSRIVDPSNTILDGGGTGSVLTFINSRTGGDFLGLTIDGFTIQNGSASLSGGGISINVGRSIITLTNNIIIGNSGGGVSASSMFGGRIILTNNTISGNSGGGVFAESRGGVDLINNIIIGNSGGGVSAFAQSAEASVITITNNTISGNSGGGVSASANGFRLSEVGLYNNTISGNNSGGVSAFAHSGGGKSVITLTNNTVGGGVFASANGYILTEMNLYNNIIYGNVSGILGDDIFTTGGNANIITIVNINICYNDFTELSGMPPVNTGTGCSDVPNNGNINADPFFIDPAGGDFRLQFGSPCIDAGFNSAPGIPSKDKDGKPRIINGVVDMGAFEFGEVEVGVVFCTDGIDNDGDGLVDCADPDCWPPCTSTTTTTTTTSTTTTTLLCRCPDSAVGCISGRVRDSSGNPLAGETVKLKKRGRRGSSTTTDGNGCFRFTGLEDGTYKVKVRRCKGGGRKTVGIADGKKVNNVDFRCR